MGNPTKFFAEILSSVPNMNSLSIGVRLRFPKSQRTWMFLSEIGLVFFVSDQGQVGVLRRTRYSACKKNLVLYQMGCLEVFFGWFCLQSL